MASHIISRNESSRCGIGGGAHGLTSKTDQILQENWASQKVCVFFSRRNRRDFLVWSTWVREVVKRSVGRLAAANIDRYIKSILGLLQGRVRVGLGCYRGRVGCYG